MNPGAAPSDPPSPPSALEEIIRTEIRTAGGAIPFARFMDLALYHPEHGYYASPVNRTGRRGDFFTNVSVGPVFGHILAAQCEEMWQRLGCPSEFTLVEQGANDARLAADILAATPTTSAEFRHALRYSIVEPLPQRRALQQETLAEYPARCTWHDSLDTLPPFTGVHLSNELVDALPFHLLRSNGPAWEEFFVVPDSEGFRFESRPPSAELSEEIKLLPLRPEGTLAELRPAAARWLEAVASRLVAGFILIIDYGWPREDLYAAHRTRGTFRAYHRHRRDENLLETPGRKDLTAHVDFTRLAETARACGLHLEGFADQHHFLIGAAEQHLRALGNFPQDPATQKSLRQLQTLLHPESMGTQFHYFCLSKTTDNRPTLGGFKHARSSGKISQS